MEICLVSDFIRCEDCQKHINNQNPHLGYRFKVNGIKISLHIKDSLKRDLCLNFIILHEVDSKDTRLGIMIVSDYYNPEVSMSSQHFLFKD